MCVFPGDWPQRNSKELQEAQWRGRGSRSLVQCYTHPLRHLPPTPEHTGYVRVSISHQLEYIFPNNIHYATLFFFWVFFNEPSHFKEEIHFFSIIFTSSCHLCLSGAVFRSHWPPPWCVITVWPLAAPFLIPAPSSQHMTALLLPITCTHTHRSLATVALS